jgi:cobalt-zinc-cadmium efflux system outer membrane protein
MMPFVMALVATTVDGLPSGGTTDDPFDEQALAAALWRGGPDVVAARGTVVDAEAAAQRAALFPNPSLNASWGTIPVGRRNPPGIRFGDVPNYTVGASQLFEIGKRGPRREAALAGVDEANQTLGELFRERFLDLLRAIGEQASAAGRAEVLARLVEGSEETLRLQKLRAARGDVAGLEVDRLEVEHLRLLSSLGEAHAAMEAAAAGCALLLGSTCPRFGSLEEALRYLGGPATPAVDDDQAIARRPDLRALEASERRARAEGLLARRQKIPDPTLGAGFTHDQFEAAGNQPNSVSVSVAVPLPVFDRGQPEAARAEVRARLAARQRETLTQAARLALSADRRRLALLAERARRLDDQAIPMARTTAERLEAAARRGGAALQDVLLARRAMEELQMDLVEVAGQAFSARLDIRRAAGSVPDPQSERQVKGK